MRRHLAIGIITLLAVAVPFAQVPDDPLAAVKRLYESASYDEALAALGQVTDQTDAEGLMNTVPWFLGLNRTERRSRPSSGGNTAGSRLRRPNHPPKLYPYRS